MEFSHRQYKILGVSKKHFFFIKYSYIHNVPEVKIFILIVLTVAWSILWNSWILKNKWNIWQICTFKFWICDPTPLEADVSNNHFELCTQTVGRNKIGHILNGGLRWPLVHSKGLKHGGKVCLHFIYSFHKLSSAFKHLKVKIMGSFQIG